MKKKTNTQVAIQQAKLALMTEPILLGPPERAQPNRKIYVVAGSLRQFEIYCQENKLRPHVEAKYVTRMDQVRGVHQAKLVLYGTWYRDNRREVDRIIDVAKHLKFEIEYLED